MRKRREHLTPLGVAFSKKERMVEILVNPARDKLDAAEVDDKALIVQLVTGERQRKRPIVSVDKSAMPGMAVLRVADRDVRINFFAGMHGAQSCVPAIVLRENFLGDGTGTRFHCLMDKQVYHADVWFEGRVQGVGFRFQTLKVAREYEVSGSVRNLADGRVLLHAEGTEREVADFIAAVAEEMKFFIRKIEKRHYLAPPCERGFQIVQ